MQEKCAIVNLSTIDLGNRIDAEYFSLEYLELESILVAKDCKQLRDYCVTTGSAFYPAAQHLYEIGDLPFIRCVDCVSFPVITMRQDLLFEKIPTSFADEHSNVKRLSKGEIVVTKVGTPCYASIIHDIDQVALSRTVLGLKSINGIDPYYLIAFLRSKYGFTQLLRERELTIQLQLTLDRVNNILVFKPTDTRLEDLIAGCFSSYEMYIGQAEQLYSEAQTLLLSELGLADWQPKPQTESVRNFSDVWSVGRMDAEYYQPKYDDIESIIKEYPLGYSQIGNEFTQNRYNFKIDTDKMYHYVEIGSVNVTTGEVAPLELLGSALPANAKLVLNKGDVIISKVRTYRGAITIVTEDGYVGSGAFCTLRESGRINKETLLAFLHSKPLLEYSLKTNRGTSYPVIADDDILKIPIPLVNPQTQEQIQQKITESFDKRRQSRALLERAKRAVEIAIEQDEAAATAWLDNAVADTC
ncbi:MAG: restriction endonuclease subunit S [Chloroflexi bacterium]|nr:restriction endonuclease subunit S [Chloroflexota bacterium]